MERHLNKDLTVHGVGSYLEHRGYVAWANEKVAADVYYRIADMLDGPDTLPEAGLAPESALKVGQLIIQAHNELGPKGYGGDPSLRKTAASRDPRDQAVEAAALLMNLYKQADALIMQGGQHTNRPGESPESIAKLDQHNRPQGAYLVGMGNSDMKVPGGAVVGRETEHPHAPANTAPTPNSLLAHSKVANIFGGTAPNGAALMERLRSAGGAVSGAMGRAGDSIADMAGSGWDTAKALGSQMSPGGAAIGAGLGGLAAGVPTYMASDDDTALRNALLAGAGGAAVGGVAGGLTPAMLGARGMSQGMQAASENRMGMAPAQLRGNNAMENPASFQMGPPKEPVKPSTSVPVGGAEDVAEQAKQGSLAGVLKSAQEVGLSNDQIVALLSKMAGGSLTDSAKNTPEDAAKHDSIAKLDQKNRSTNEHLVGVGNTKMPNKGQQLAVEHRSEQPGTKEKSPSTVPSRETKSAADEAFMAIFNKTAEEVGQHLPADMHVDTKIAHVRRMMGMTNDERAEYIGSLRR